MSVVESASTPHSPEHESASTAYLESALGQPTLNSLADSTVDDNATSNKGNDEHIDIDHIVGGSSSNPLNEFAQQVLGVGGDEADSDAHNLLDLGRGGMGYSIISEEQTFNDLLQNEERREKQQQQKKRLNGSNHDDHDMDDDDDDDGIRHHNDEHIHEHEIDPRLEHELSRQFQEQDQGQGQDSEINQEQQIILDENGNPITIEVNSASGVHNPDDHNLNSQITAQQQQQQPNLNLVYGGRIGKRKRISHHNSLGDNGTGAGGRLDEIVTDAHGNPVSPHEYVRLKKDSHKEVERRRRVNINDGINEIAQLVPGGKDKQGKSTLLKRAATYLIELTEKLRIGEEETTKREIEKQDLEAQLAHLQAQMQEERDRSMRFETSWREAEDRAASSNFELERIRAELEELRGVQRSDN
ncbi:uncharacterized protein L201_003454 [Kwoniella dendrophila CBS 6074]|uniref:BHLH domain-containing protein n=1 Tax=Kwoniella dendrophila CBS 6074 TaxID=1295534 RepID=A0AAX4JVK3_9TREE